MKKSFLIFLLVFCFVFASCDPGSFYFSTDYLNNVVSIELIDYTNTEQKSFSSWAHNHFNKLKPFNLENSTTIETLETDKIENFNLYLTEQVLYYRFYTYNSPKGLCLKLNFANGDFIIISDVNKKGYNGYVGRYSSTGKVLDYYGCFCSEDSFVNLVNNYFNTQV